MVVNTPDAELRKQMRNELLDYAHGQIISGTPIDEHLDRIMKLITADRSRLVREIREKLPAKKDREDYKSWEEGHQRNGYNQALSEVAALLEEYEK